MEKYFLDSAPLMLPKLKMVGELEVTHRLGMWVMGEMAEKYFEEKSVFFNDTLRDLAPMVEKEIVQSIAFHYAPVQNSGIAPTLEELKEACWTVITPPSPKERLGWAQLSGETEDAIDAFLHFESDATNVEMQYISHFNYHPKTNHGNYTDISIPCIQIGLCYVRSLFESSLDLLLDDTDYTDILSDTTISVAAFGGDMLDPLYPEVFTGDGNDLDDPAWVEAFHESFVDTISKIKALHW